MAFTCRVLIILAAFAFLTVLPVSQAKETNGSRTMDEKKEQPNHIHGITYSVSEASQDKVYKQLNYEIVLDGLMGKNITSINPGFEFDFYKTIYQYNVEFKKTSQTKHANGLVVEVVVTFNSAEYNLEKLNEQSAIESLDVEIDGRNEVIMLSDSKPTLSQKKK